MAALPISASSPRRSGRGVDSDASLEREGTSNPRIVVAAAASAATATAVVARRSSMGGLAAVTTPRNRGVGGPLSSPSSSSSSPSSSSPASILPSSSSSSSSSSSPSTSPLQTSSRGLSPERRRRLRSMTRAAYLERRRRRADSARRLLRRALIASSFVLAVATGVSNLRRINLEAARYSYSVRRSEGEGGGGGADVRGRAGRSDVVGAEYGGTYGGGGFGGFGASYYVPRKLEDRDDEVLRTESPVPMTEEDGDGAAKAADADGPAPSSTVDAAADESQVFERVLNRARENLRRCSGDGGGGDSNSGASGAEKKNPKSGEKATGGTSKAAKGEDAHTYNASASDGEKLKSSGADGGGVGAGGTTTNGRTESSGVATAATTAIVAKAKKKKKSPLPLPLPPAKKDEEAATTDRRKRKRRRGRRKRKRRRTRALLDSSRLLPSKGEDDESLGNIKHQNDGNGNGERRAAGEVAGETKAEVEVGSEAKPRTTASAVAPKESFPNGDDAYVSIPLSADEASSEGGDDRIDRTESDGTARDGATGYEKAAVEEESPTEYRTRVAPWEAPEEEEDDEENTTSSSSSPAPSLLGLEPFGVIEALSNSTPADDGSSSSSSRCRLPPPSACRLDRYAAVVTSTSRLRLSRQPEAGLRILFMNVFKLLSFTFVSDVIVLYEGGSGGRSELEDDVRYGRRLMDWNDDESHPVRVVFLPHDEGEGGGEGENGSPPGDLWSPAAVAVVGNVTSDDAILRVDGTTALTSSDDDVEVAFDRWREDSLAIVHVGRGAKEGEEEDRWDDLVRNDGDSGGDGGETAGLVPYCPQNDSGGGGGGNNGGGGGGGEGLRLSASPTTPLLPSAYFLHRSYLCLLSRPPFRPVRDAVAASLALSLVPPAPPPPPEEGLYGGEEWPRPNEAEKTRLSSFRRRREEADDLVRAAETTVVSALVSQLGGRPPVLAISPSVSSSSSSPLLLRGTLSSPRRRRRAERRRRVREERRRRRKRQKGEEDGGLTTAAAKMTRLLGTRMLLAAVGLGGGGGGAPWAEESENGPDDGDGRDDDDYDNDDGNGGHNGGAGRTNSRRWSYGTAEWSALAGIHGEAVRIELASYFGSTFSGVEVAVEREEEDGRRQQQRPTGSRNAAAGELVSIGTTAEGAATRRNRQRCRK